VGDGKRARGKPTPDPHCAGSGYCHGKTLNGVNAAPQGDGCLNRVDSRLLTLQVTVLPKEEDFEAMGKFNEEMVNAGVLLAGEGLHPSSKGARITYSADKRTVVDGPFAETKELLAGFTIIQVKSKEEAIEWASRMPFSQGEVVEIRQVFEADDFGEAFTPELQEKEARLRAQSEALQ
jgi:hypothetical protein